MATKRDEPSADSASGQVVPPERHRFPPHLPLAARPIDDRNERRGPSWGEQGRVEVIGADGAVQTRVVLDALTVGRHVDNDVQLLDPEVSKSHCVIRRHKEGYVVEDLGSANGTSVDGVRCTRRVLYGDESIVIGSTTLRFRIERSAPSSGDEGRRSPAQSPSKATNAPELGRSGDGEERTTVTLIPEASVEGERVLAHPVALDFKAADLIGEERELRRDYERMRVAFDLANAIGLVTDLETLGSRILARILDVLPADTAVVMLHEPGQGLATLASFAGRGREVRIPRAIVERVVASGQALLTSDALSDLQLRRSETVVGQRIRSALCVPLVVQGEVLGVIHLSSSSAAGAYEERDLALLRAIAQPAALAVANARLVRTVEETAQQRAELSRFLSPALIEKVLRDELNVAKAGDRVRATILFCDIRGFTSLAGGRAPEAVVSMLNEYFEAMVEVVFDLGGTLDKFIGDGLMAVWGTPIPRADDPMLAVMAAASMREALDDHVNVARRRRGEPPLAAGYGIATGPVIAGAMGARRRQDFTVVGDAVNLASRLCGDASPGEILVDEGTAEACAHGGLTLTGLDARVVKGVARPVPVWQVPRDAVLHDRPLVAAAAARRS